MSWMRRMSLNVANDAPLGERAGEFIGFLERCTPKQ